MIYSQSWKTGISILPLSVLLHIEVKGLPRYIGHVELKVKDYSESILSSYIWYKNYSI